MVYIFLGDAAFFRVLCWCIVMTEAAYVLRSRGLLLTRCSKRQVKTHLDPPTGNTDLCPAHGTLDVQRSNFCPLGGCLLDMRTWEIEH